MSSKGDPSYNHPLAAIGPLLRNSLGQIEVGVIFCCRSFVSYHNIFLWATFKAFWRLCKRMYYVSISFSPHTFLVGPIHVPVIGSQLDSCIVPLILLHPIDPPITISRCPSSTTAIILGFWPSVFAQ